MIPLDTAVALYERTLDARTLCFLPSTEGCTVATQPLDAYRWLA